jgi:hypothetical protein
MCLSFGGRDIVEKLSPSAWEIGFANFGFTAF